MERGQGVGPFRGYIRGQGVGPFTPRVPLRGGTPYGRTHSKYSRRGGGLLSFMASQFKKFKEKFLPLAARHAGSLAQIALDHAKSHKDEYIKSLTEHGVPGIARTFVRHLPSMGSNMITSIASRGSGDVPEEVNQMLHILAPTLAEKLVLQSHLQKDQDMKASLDILESGRGGHVQLPNPMAPLQNAFDIVSATVLDRELIENASHDERGGILPLLGILAPVLGSLGSALISSIPSIIKTSRGSGPLHEIIRPRLLNASTSEANNDQNDCVLSRRQTASHPIKVTLRRQDQKGGRPKIYYAPVNLSF